MGCLYEFDINILSQGSDGKVLVMYLSCDACQGTGSPKFFWKTPEEIRVPFLEYIHKNYLQVQKEIQSIKKWIDDRLAIGDYFRAAHGENHSPFRYGGIE